MGGSVLQVKGSIGGIGTAMEEDRVTKWLSKVYLGSPTRARMFRNPGIAIASGICITPELDVVAM